MRRDDDISNLFKRHQHKLEERPSMRAWHRLEQKLDDEKAHQRRLIYRYVSTVAAVIAMLAMVTAIALFNQESSNGQLSEHTIAPNIDNSDAEKIAALKEKEGINKTSEELKKEQGVVDQEEINYEEEASDSEISNPTAINEIPTRPKNIESTVTIPTKDKTTSPKIKGKSVITNPTKEITTNKPITDSKLKPTIKKKTENKPIRTEPIETTVSSPPIVTTEKPKPSAFPEKKEQLNPTLSEEYVINDNVEYPQESEVMAGESRRNSNYKAKKRSKSYKRKSKSKPKKPSYSLKQFKWLVGEWRETKHNGYSVEKWKKTSKNTLKGVGYLVQNGDTSYVENFSIKASKGTLYYISRVEPKGALIKFKLISFDGQKAIFENKKINFPNQVILERNHYNNFSTIFQNSNKMNLEQQKNFQNRNNISNERAVRNLSRAKNKK